MRTGWIATSHKIKAKSKSLPARIVVWMLVALVTVPGVLYMVPGIAGQDHAFLVLSGSMVPFFDPGDVIFVNDIDPATLQVGDVVTFRAKPGSSTLITHRVIEVLNDGDGVRYRTQGDANEDPDPFVVKQEMVVGVYSSQIPKWGLIIQALRSKAGYFGLVLLPASIVIVREFVTLYRTLDAADHKRKEEATGRAT